MYILHRVCVCVGYAVAQWLGFYLQLLGVAMVAGVSFLAVLEHHFSTVDPGIYCTLHTHSTLGSAEHTYTSSKEYSSCILFFFYTPVNLGSSVSYHTHTMYVQCTCIEWCKWPK